jgi:hypothetical protein
MAKARLVVFYLTNSTFDGQWHEVPADKHIVANRQGLPDWKFVPTGNVEWDGNRCAEVWVPEEKLTLWKAEHDA